MAARCDESASNFSLNTDFYGLKTQKKKIDSEDEEKDMMERRPLRIHEEGNARVRRRRRATEPGRSTSRNGGPEGRGACEMALGGANGGGRHRASLINTLHPPPP